MYLLEKEANPSVSCSLGLLEQSTGKVYEYHTMILTYNFKALTQHRTMILFGRLIKKQNCKDPRLRQM